MAISARKYPISISKEQLEYFRGFTPSLGSGLQFANKDNSEVIKFLAVTDRGPNSQHEVYEDSIVYYTEDYVVTILELDLDINQNKTVISKLLPIMNNKKGVSGINPDYYAADEATYSTKKEQIYSKFGIDSEAIAIAANGDYVISEEYYPSIITVNPINGQIKEIFTPEGFKDVNDVLPTVLKYRYVNRGFESVAVTPNGKVYAVLEGPLNFDKNTLSNAKLFRIIELDMNTNSVKTFAYPYNYELYSNALSPKIGDIAAIDNNNFLVVEQGKTNNGTFCNLIYKFNIEGATDITNLRSNDGRQLEHLSLDELQAESINFVHKDFILNPREFGWTQKKLEGLAIINQTTIALTFDNDFGVEGYKYEYPNPLGLHHEYTYAPILAQATNEIWIFNSTEPFF